MATHSRSTSRHPILFLITVLFIVLTPVLGTVAQTDPPVRTSPTEEPDGPNSLQANPTEEPDLPIRVNPTQEPTREPIDDVVANPTREPTREPIDDMVANPTERPTDDPIDDVVANPTEAPAIDDEAIPTTGTVRVVKRDCPPGIVEDATLSEYLKLCPQEHDGVEFVLNDVNGAQAGVTASGAIEWTGVDPGVFNITETVPAGYGDPIVFCGYTESPGGGVQHPSLQQSPGGIVAGTFPDTMFEYVCYWMNIEAPGQVIPGADDVANPGGAGGTSTLTVKKLACPFGIASDLSSNIYADECTTPLDGVNISLTHANGGSTKPTAGGEATWQGLPIPPYTIQEAIPVGYGDPLVLCSVLGFEGDGAGLFHSISFNTTENGAFELDLDSLADNDLPEIGYTDATCTMYNIPLGPGGFTPAEDLTNSLTVQKWICPDSAQNVVDQAELESQCELSTFPVEFALTNADGASTQATDPAWTTWDDVPLGEFTLQETIPDGYGEPITFCNWTATYEGNIYDSFSHLVPSPGGLIEGEITIPNTSFACDVYNVAAGVGLGGPGNVVANPADESNTLVAHAWSCEAGTAADAHLLDYFEECQLADTAVEFTLSSADGDSTQATAGGTVQWDDVPLGAFTLQEQVPSGSRVLAVWCGWTAFHNGAVYDAFSQPVPFEEGLVSREISVPNSHFRCDFMNVPVTIDDLQANPTERPTEEPIDDVVANPTEVPAIDDVTTNPGPASLTISLAECRSDSIPGDDIYSEDVEFFSEWCDMFTTEFEFTVASEGGFTESQTTTGFGVTFGEIPVASITITETIPTGWDEPMVLCWSDQVDPAGWHIGNDVPWNVAAGEQVECLWVNVTGDEYPFFRAHAQVCPPGVDTSTNDWLLIFSECNVPIDGVEFSFTDASGSSTQPLTGMWVQWNQVGIGEGQTVELVEDFPAGYTDPIVACVSEVSGGDPSDWHYEPIEANGGTILVTPNLDGGNGPLGVILPGRGYTCRFLHFAIEGIDDLQANPTEVPEIDDVVANPTAAPTEEPIDDVTSNPSSPGTLTVHTWECPPAYDPVVGNALEDCTESLNGITFDLVNHAQGQPDFQATTGDAIDGAAVFEPQPGTYSLKEQLPDGYGVPFLWNCTGLTNIPDDLEPPLSTINFFRIVIAPGQVIECDWMNVPTGAGFGGPDDLQANPTEVPEIDDLQANPVDPTHVVTIGSLACPAGVNPTDDYWVAIEECVEPLAGVAFTLTTDAGPAEGTTGGVTDALGGTVWPAVDLGDSGEIQLREELPAGYGEPEVWCVDYPEVEVADPFDLEFVQYEAVDGLITAIPEQHEPYRFGCVFFNIVADVPD